MNIDVVKITPEIARTYLNANPNNRAINLKDVNKLADDMKAGRFVSNGETIKIDSNMELLDGQHRLEACALSGVPFEAIIVTDLPPDVFPTIDKGRGRSFADSLYIQGFKSPKVCAPVCVCGLAHERLNANIINTPKNEGIRDTDVIDYAEAHRDALVHTTAFYHAIAKSRLGGYSAMASAAFLVGKHYGSETRERIESRMLGENLNVNDPIFLLRNRLMANAVSRSKLTSYMVYQLTFKATSLSLKDQHMKTLKIGDSEAFHFIIGQ